MNTIKRSFKNRINFYQIKVIIYAFIFLFSTCSLVYIYGSSREEQKKTESWQHVSIPVKVAKVKKDSIEISYQTSATLKPVKEVFIGTDVKGKVQKIFVEEGDRGLKGALLLKIDQEELNLRVNQAQKALLSAAAAIETQELNCQNSNREWKRIQKLFQKGVVSQQTFDQTEDTYKAALAGLKLAKAKHMEAQANLGEHDTHKTNSHYLSDHYLRPYTYGPGYRRRSGDQKAPGR